MNNKISRNDSCPCGSGQKHKRCHDGKIFTFGKKQSNPLTVGIGHLFTVHLKGLKGFDAKNDKKEYSAQKIDLDVDLLESDDDTIKFVAWWYDYAAVHPSNRRFNRNYLFKTDDGKTHWCFALQAPKTHPLSNMVLLLTSGTEFMTKEKGSHLLLVGGFDKKEIVKISLRICSFYQCCIQHVTTKKSNNKLEV